MCSFLNSLLWPIFIFLRHYWKHPPSWFLKLWQRFERSVHLPTLLFFKGVSAVLHPHTFTTWILPVSAKRNLGIIRMHWQSSAGDTKSSYLWTWNITLQLQEYKSYMVFFLSIFFYLKLFIIIVISSSDWFIYRNTTGFYILASVSRDVTEFINSGSFV